MGRSFALAVMILLLSGGAAGAGWAPEKGGAARAPDDVYWFGDHRITVNAASDECPELYLEDGWWGHLVWERDGRSQLYKMFVGNGTTTVSDTYVANASAPRQRTGQPATRLARGFDGLYTFWFEQSGSFVAYRGIDWHGGLRDPVLLRPIKSNTQVGCLPVGSFWGYPMFAYEGDNGKIATAGYDGQYLTFGVCATVPGQGVVLGSDGKGGIHLFNRGLSGTGLYHTKFGTNGKLYDDTHWIDTAVSGSPPEIAMPRVAFGGDGSIHILQASGVTGRRSLYYTILDNNGTKLTPDMLVTGTAADFGDIELDSLRNVHLVWGDAVDGQIHHLKIRPGSDNRTWAPAAITNSGVNARDPDLDISNDDRLGLVWVDGRDGNSEIYFKLGESPGVKISTLGQSWSIRPGETRSANLTISNTGALPDTMRLSLDVDFRGLAGGTGGDWNGTGWKVWLSDERVEVEGQNSTMATINVRGPPKGNRTDYITVRIDVISGLEPLKNDYVVFSYNLNPWRVAFEMGCSGSSMDITGGSAQYEITIANKGEIGLTVELNATSRDDWNYSLDKYRVFVLVSKVEKVYLVVTAPSDLNRVDSAVVNVIGLCAEDPTLTDSVRTSTGFLIRPSLAMSADPYEAEVDPGGTAVVNISVANTGKNASGSYVELIALADDPAWHLKDQWHYMWVDSGRYGTWPLEVLAPVHAKAGRRVQIDVVGTDSGWRLNAAVHINVTVRQVHDLGINVSPKMIDLLPGGTDIISVEVSNLGNGPEELLTLNTTLPAGWTQSREWAAGSRLAAGRLTLEAWETARCWLSVTVPFNAPAGVYPVDFTLQKSKGTTIAARAEIRVGQVFRVGLTAVGPVDRAVPGNAVSLALELLNKGNCNDSVGFVFEGLPETWSQNKLEDSDHARFENLSLGPGERARVYATVAVPEDFSGTRMDFSLAAVSAGGARDSVRLGFDVLQANLVAAGIEWRPAPPGNGSGMILTVRVANTGTLDAENVHVRLWDGNESLGFGTLAIVPAGAERSLPFDWRPAPGRHALRLEVDPAGTVRETEERDNILEKSVVVEERTPETHQAPANYWRVGSAAVVLAGVVALAIALGKRRASRKAA